MSQRTVLSIVVGTLVTTGLLAASAPASAQTDPLINEFVANHTGSDTEAFVEIFGDPSTDYSAFTILEIEGDSTGAGVIDAALPVGSTDAGGFFVDPEDAENGTITWLLVEGFTGSTGTDLDTDNDGVLDSTPWTRLVDDVGVTDGGGSDRVYSAIVLSPGFDGVPFTPGGASRIPNGADTDSVSDWVRNDFDGAGLPGFPGTPEAGEALNTPGAENELIAASDPLINEFVNNHTGADTEAFVEIFGDPSTDYSAFTILEIEGDGSAAGIVDAVLPVGTTDAGGFFVDPEDAENGTVTWLLVEGFTGALFTDLDTDNDGVLDSTPWDRIVDDVATTDGGSSDRTYSATVLGPFFDGNPFGAGGASRIPNGTDTDSAADWVRNDFDGAGFPGFPGSPALGEALNTPGAVNALVPPPSSPALVINEILQNPSAVSDGAGEWFELFNPTTDPVDLDGWTIKDDDFDSFTISGSLVIPAGGFLVFGNNDDSATNGGVAVDFEYSGMFLSNGSDELVLLDDFASEVDRVEWDNGATFPDPNGASMALKNPVLDNSVGANWCESSTPFGDGDLGTPGAPNDCFARLVINEVDADDTSGDDEEFIELYDGGDGGTDLTGLVLVLYNGSDDASYDAFDLDGLSTDGDGFFVLCGDAAKVSGCDLDVTPDTNLIQNGADAVALYAGDGADFPNDTPVTTAGLLDALVYDTNDSDDAGLLVLLNPGQPQVNEDGAGDKDLHSNQRCPNGFGGQRNTDTYVQDTPTPAALNNCPPLEIYTIQGSGLASIYDGFFVGTDADVVTAVSGDGFFMQTPAAGSDGDGDTSDGIFVFTGSPVPPVAVGDLVDVTGKVDEFFGFTELTGSPSVTVVGSGAVPAAVAFGASVPTQDPTAPSCAIEYECYEGMRVSVAEGTVTGPNQRFGPDPVAEVHIVARDGRAFREPGVEFPGLGMPPIPTWDGNPEVFELDPDKLGLTNLIIPGGSRFSAEGVLGFEFGGYELWPTALVVDPAPLPVPVRPRGAGELTVATLNLFRLFDDIDDPADPDGRNDTVVPTAEYERRLDKLCRYIAGVLDAPDILAVQEAESLQVLQDLADHIAADTNCAAFVDYTPYLEEGNDFGTIDVGFLVRERITVDAVTQLGKDETFIDPTEGDEDILHDRPPLLLEGSCELEFGSYPISVMVVHNRSLNQIDDPDRGPFVRFKRYLQAESIAEKVQAIQGADPDVRLVVLGDFNAFEFTDGYADTVNVVRGDWDPAQSFVCSELTCDPDPVEPDLDNVVLGLDAGERYSFIFRGTGQVLDHALTSEGLAGEVAGAEYGRGNADAAFDLFSADGTPLRSSDHDGLVVYLTKDEDADGVPNDLDVCAGTVIPESVPTVELKTNRWALIDDDGQFDTNPPEGEGPGLSFDLGDTAGCSCEQIIAAQGLGLGHTKHGCSNSAMLDWVALVNP